MPFSKKIYTVKDIEALPDGQRAELINGEMFMMVLPTLIHQMLLGWLSAIIYNYIENKKGKCIVLQSFGVRLHRDDMTYVEPDISVTCDREKLEEKGCNGAPDWVIEIVSPSSRKMDYEMKLREYKKAGVREYWIVDPDKCSVQVYNLEKDQDVKEYGFTDKVKVNIYEDLEIDFAQMKTLN